VRPDDHPGDDVAEDDRLAQAPEDDGRGGGRPQHQRQIAEKLVGIAHLPNIRRPAGVSTG
jgi:hypothetical protein